LGKLLFIRVPLPAAITTTSSAAANSDMKQLPLVLGAPLSATPAKFSLRWIISLVAGLALLLGLGGCSA
jgi:hypothetical protein